MPQNRLTGTRMYDDANGQLVAYTGTAGQSAAINANEVTVVASSDCYVKFGANPTATVGAGSMFLKAGEIFTRKITYGWKVSAVQASAGGNLCVMPVSL